MCGDVRTYAYTSAVTAPASAASPSAGVSFKLLLDQLCELRTDTAQARHTLAGDSAASHSQQPTALCFNEGVKSVITFNVVSAHYNDGLLPAPSVEEAAVSAVAANRRGLICFTYCRTLCFRRQDG